jgi:flagellar hook-associated protein 3 FlgL
MDIGPLLPGRIPNTLLGSRLLSNLQQSTQDLTKLQEQISTGQRFFLPSEAPSAAVQTIGLQKLLERKTQALTNIGTNQSFLGATDNALSSISDALNTAKQIVLSGTGTLATPEERKALATQAGAVIQQLLNTANTEFRGRYLFAGSDSKNIPFTGQPDGTVRYNGDRQSVQSLIDLNTLLSNSLDGDSAFRALGLPVGNDVNPALTLNTKVADLLGGQGVALGQITVTLDNGGTPQTQTIDLAGANTIGDLKTRLENAFSGGPLTLTVAVDPASRNGLKLTSSAGTVAVADIAGGLTATDLGIQSAAAAAINGSDLNPRLTLQTTLAALNGGTGIAATAGKGLLITNGSKSATIDISGATAVQDLFNLLQKADIDVDTQINSAGNGLAISSRLSGANFSVGENGDTSAASLGIRTLDGNTPLSELNLGQGGFVNSGPLKITRRDGTAVSVDLSSARTMQDVLTALNAVDPGNLVASLKTVGNGLQITDNSGTGPLAIDSNNTAKALGVNGTETGSNPAVALVGKDVNPRSVGGTFDILVRLQTAVSSGDNSELQRLSGLLDQEISRVNQTRGEIGGRQKILDGAQNRIEEENLQIKDSLSKIFDTDSAEALTQLASRQFALQATLKIAGQALQLSLVSYL